MLIAAVVVVELSKLFGGGAQVDIFACFDERNDDERVGVGVGFDERVGRVGTMLDVVRAVGVAIRLDDVDTAIRVDVVFVGVDARGAFVSGTRFNEVLLLDGFEERVDVNVELLFSDLSDRLSVVLLSDLCARLKDASVGRFIDTLLFSDFRERLSVDLLCSDLRERVVLLSEGAVSAVFLLDVTVVLLSVVLGD